MTKKIFNIILSFMLLVISGCSDEWLENKAPHLITAETLFVNLDGFEAALNGLYATHREEFEATPGVYELRKAMYVAGTDNSTLNHQGDGSYIRLVAGRWGAHNNSLLSDYAQTWAWFYNIINQSNTIINRAERPNVDWGSGSSAIENKNRILANAKALRAWAYRHLTYGWGDVPLSLIESGEVIKTDWERTPIKEVRQQIISDLLFAEKHIAVRPREWGRITKGAVQTYLAEMYLVLNKPDSTLYWADKAINTPEYKLITERYGVKKDQPGVPLMDMFTEGNENYAQGNTEALWVVQFALDVIGGQSQGCRFIRALGSRYADWVYKGTRVFQITYDRGGRGQSRQSLTNWALGSYEPQDHRASEHAIRWFFVINDAERNAPYPADTRPPGYNYGDTIWLDWSNDLSPDNMYRPNRPFSRKPEGADPNNPASGYQFNDQIYLRLAETYFLKAEAEYLLGRAEDAANTLNIIRRRSNASEITASDVDIDFILDERSRELVYEEDRRWHLLRTGKWFERVRKYNNNGGQFIAERDTIWPIPQVVIDANITKEFPQNPGF
jgi:starch-binding outer membrane protein, SusD/RagB family